VAIGSAESPFALQQKGSEKMGKFGGFESRNHGFGKQLAYAGRQAIQDRYAGGHYGSVRSHSERWADFASWAKAQGINDARRLTVEHVAAYGRDLADRDLAIATIQNRLSTVNTTLEQMRGDRALRVSPAEIAGERSNVREAAPATSERDTYTTAMAALDRAGHDRAAATLALARQTGMREREAIMQDLRRLQREAKAHGQINVTDGTKGGRTADRWVPLTDRGREAIERAVQASPIGSRNLIDPAERYIDARREIDRARDTLKEQGVPGYHDARAAYAAYRYREITGADAPVIAGARQVDRATDREARAIIAHELGHGRTDVTASYLGSSK